jgi:hypothetical protein
LWHPDGVLYEVYGHRVVYDSVLRKKVCSWPPARSDSLVQIQNRLHDMEIGNEHQPDWNCSKKGQYSCSETWEAVHFRLPMVSLWKMVWFNLSIPRHAFILWLVARKRIIY